MELEDETMAITKEDLDFFYGRFLRAYQFHRGGRDPGKITVPAIHDIYSPITGNRIPVEYVEVVEAKGISAKEVLAGEVAPSEETPPSQEAVDDATGQLGAEEHRNPAKPKRARSSDASESNP